MKEMKAKICVQLYEKLIDVIYTEIPSEGKFLSANEIAERFTVCVSTAQKVTSKLRTHEFLKKQRGVGMFLTSKAKEKAYDYKKGKLIRLLADIETEMKKIDISKADVLEYIDKNFYDTTEVR